MRRCILARSLLPGCVLVLVPLAAVAQGSVLDRGAFRLTVRGQDAGTESFSIRQDGAGSDAAILAQGTVALDSSGVSRELTSVLRFSPATTHTAQYRLTIKGAGAEQLTGTLAGGRFSARIVTPTGEMMREYLASDNAIVVDEGIAHQWYLVGRQLGAAGTRVALVVPRLNRQVAADVTPAGTDTLEIGGAGIAARHYKVDAAGRPACDLWIDASGRVLKLSIPSLGVEATRISAPG